MTAVTQETARRDHEWMSGRGSGVPDGCPSGRRGAGIYAALIEVVGRSEPGTVGRPRLYALANP